MKILYSTIRALEDYKRGDNQRTAAEILFDKIFWTFQPDKIGDLVTKGADSPLSCLVQLDGRDFIYKFGKDTTKQITSLENHVQPRENNSIFLPAKEVLSLHHIILKSREQDMLFGFDDTYLDLARALRYLPTMGKNYKTFADARQNLEEILGGRVEFDKASERWQFKKGSQKFPMGVTAEGIKKIAILDILLGNRSLAPGSIVFIDEPESALHPTAIAKFLDIIALLATSGIQFFLASHSYFVVKKLFLIAQQQHLSIPFVFHCENSWRLADLKDDMPGNPIIDESVRLYKEEVKLVLQ